MTKYMEMDLVSLHELLKSGKVKPIDLVNECLERIESSNLNAFITVCSDSARSRALELEGTRCDSLLWGIPIALKDNIVTKVVRTTCGSYMLDNFVPVYDSHVVDLINKSGMIIIGKTNMDEFAMGSSNQTSYYGPVKNPWNEALVSGGSSGGSAAAVSSLLSFMSLGSDTGGSIRQPSAFCGCVGLKPTYGRVSRYGLVAFGSSLDQIGPITKRVYENAVLLNALCVKDDRDLTNVSKACDFTSLIGKDISGLKICIPSFFINDSIDKEIIDRFNFICDILKSKGCVVDVVDIPYIDYAVPLYQIIAMGEASSNLARFDGVKYGFSYKDVSNLEELYKKTRALGFGDEVKRRIMIGSYLLSGPNAITYYNKALKIRKAMCDAFSKVFEDYDLIIGPTTTTLPYEINSTLDDPNKSFVDDILSIPVNMAGLPGMSLPIGFSKSKLPIGMQIIGNRFDEALIYQLASCIEKEGVFNE